MKRVRIFETFWRLFNFPQEAIRFTMYIKILQSDMLCALGNSMRAMTVLYGGGRAGFYENHLGDSYQRRF